MIMKKNGTHSEAVLNSSIKTEDQPLLLNTKLIEAHKYEICLEKWKAYLFILKLWEQMKLL